MAEPDLRAATALRRDADQALIFRGDISEDWTIVRVYGGVSFYTALRAMCIALDRPDLAIRMASCLFFAPIPAGPVTVTVDLVRVGRGTAYLSADVRTPDSDAVALRASAVFGTSRDIALDYGSEKCPDVPPPSAVEVRRHSPAVRFPFDDRTEWRPIRGLDSQDGPILAWERLRVGDPDLLSLVLHSDVLGVAVERLGAFTVLSLQIDVRFLATPTTPWVLQEIDAWAITDGYAVGPALLWDEDRRLCAVATQTAQVRPAHGP